MRLRVGGACAPAAPQFGALTRRLRVARASLSGDGAHARGRPLQEAREAGRRQVLGGRGACLLTRHVPTLPLSPSAAHCSSRLFFSPGTRSTSPSWSHPLPRRFPPYPPSALLPPLFAGGTACAPDRVGGVVFARARRRPLRSEALQYPGRRAECDGCEDCRLRPLSIHARHGEGQADGGACVPRLVRLVASP